MNSQILNEAPEGWPTKKYAAVHTHSYGTSVYLFETDKDVSTLEFLENLIEVFNIDFDEENQEWIDICEVTPEFIRI